MIVLDASAAVDWLLRIGASARIEQRVLRAGETLHVPHLFDIEVVHAFRRLALQRDLTELRGREALEDFVALDLTRYAHLPLVERIWALRHRVSTFDAAYLALAEALDAPLITSDRRLGQAGNRRARVEVYAA